MTRRLLRLIAGVTVLGWAGAAAVEFRSTWHEESDRIWLGEDFRPERLADWRLRGGRAECVAPGDGGPGAREVRVLSRRLGEEPGAFLVELEFGALAPQLPVEAGVRFGTGDAAWRAGMDRAGRVFAGAPVDGEAETEPKVSGDGGFRLLVEGTPAADGRTEVRVRCFGEGETLLGEQSASVPSDQLAGGIGFWSGGGAGLSPAWIGAIRVEGPRVVADPAARFGPVVGTLHTLSRGVLKLTAQLMPVGPDDPERVFLETARQGIWETIGESVIEAPGWTATFRVPNWRHGEDVAYRVVYGDHSWGGTIRRNPVERNDLAVAVLAETGKLSAEAAAELLAGVAEQGTDVLFFPGGQVTRPAGPISVDAGRLILDYLQSWYDWQAAFRGVTRDLPAVVMPGPSDVFQARLWGEGGRPTLSEPFGGYVQPAAFLQVVHRTQSSHLPDAFDPRPARQGIPAWDGELNYGRVSFALLDDRKWKSGCLGIGLPLKEDAARPEWVPDDAVDPRQLDLPGLRLLGDRQLEFLRAWAADWTQSDLKAALSGGILAQLATNQGSGLEAVGADLGSNGWPQGGRRRALEALRKAGAVHIASDGGLASVFRHGTDTHDDAVVSFAAPSAAPDGQRLWKPRLSGAGRESGQPFWMGRHLDGLRNPVTVFAVAPAGAEVPPSAGFGVARFDRAAREVRFEAWQRAGGDEGVVWKQADGWPVVVAQDNNFAGPPRNWLPPLQVSGVAEPVVQVWSVATEELVYAIRLRQPMFTPWVLEPGRYDLRIGDPDTGLWIDLKGVEAAEEPYREARIIEF